MSWFSRKPEEGSSGRKVQIAEGLWIKCDSCKEIIYRQEVERGGRVCPKCRYPFRISARERLSQLADPGTFEERDGGMASVDPLKFKDTKWYRDRVKTAREKTGTEEAVVTGLARIGGQPAVLAVFEFGFLGGSMGSVVGEKLTRAIELAIDKHVPIVIVSASGGARMQEGILSLMQMAKTSAALERLGSAGLPYVSVLTDPTTGGVTASFAMLGDVILAEPRALIGFAGPRVIAETIRQPLPEGFQRSEFLLEHGQIDDIVERRDLKDTLRRLLAFFADDPTDRLVMTYAEAVGRLLALRGGEHAGMRPGLERIEGLLGALGNPEKRYALVQVGGTNGKGSVAAMLAAILKASGRRVGLYTSPHLVSFRERIRVDGDAIGRDALVDGVEALGTLIARFDASMFEASTALALDHFAHEAVDVAVLEVGLGGRLDSTTVGAPVVTVLTSIAMDHEAWLGSTLEAIAGEKAAILRSGVAFSAAQPPDVAAVVARHAERARVPLSVVGRDLSVHVRSSSLAGSRIDCAGPGWRLDDLALALPGAYQPPNALLAVAGARALGAPDAAIRDGLARVAWPGRFQVIGSPPRLVLDGAHNPAGAAALAPALRDMFPGQPITLVIAIAADKDARGILGALAPVARRVILTRSSSTRSADPGDLAAAMPAGAARPETAGSVAEALLMASSGPVTPITCVAGSLFTVADALRTLGYGDDKVCPVEKPAASMESL